MTGLRYPSAIEGCILAERYAVCVRYHLKLEFEVDHEYVKLQFDVDRPA